MMTYTSGYTVPVGCIDRFSVFTYTVRYSMYSIDAVCKDIRDKFMYTNAHDSCSYNNNKSVSLFHSNVNLYGK